MMCQLVTLHVAATASDVRAWSTDHGPLIAIVMTTTTSEAGASRRIRLLQKCRRSLPPVRVRSLSSSEVIRNPLSVKNSDTPRNPPRTASMPEAASAWKATTPAMTMPRIPSSAGSYARNRCRPSPAVVPGSGSTASVRPATRTSGHYGPPSFVRRNRS